jgi:NTE family protein
MIGGHDCADMQGELIHLSLANVDNPADRARLQAVPTSLTIPAADVDMLVAYGGAWRGKTRRCVA